MDIAGLLKKTENGSVSDKITTLFGGRGFGERFWGRELSKIT